jgi:hypothetical protein
MQLPKVETGVVETKAFPTVIGAKMFTEGNQYCAAGAGSLTCGSQTFSIPGPEDFDECNCVANNNANGGNQCVYFQCVGFTVPPACGNLC